MVEQKDWKSRYDELLTQHEEQTAADAELRQLLTRTITRLTLAAGGLDAKLDPHLKQIREAVRRGVDPALKQYLEALSDSLIHSTEEQAEGADKQATGSLCELLLDRFPLGRREKLEASQLLNGLMTNPQQVESESLARLISLLNTPLETLEGKRPGLLGRLLGSKPLSEAHEAISSNNVLLNLLEQASWPGHWGKDISEFKERLSKQSEDDAWIGVLRDLLDLSSRSFGEAKAEIQEAEAFLGELTRRLQELEEYFRKMHGHRSDLMEQGRRLNADVTTQVGAIESTVNTANDLQQLKRDVSARLQAIHHTMDTFLQEEAQRFMQIELNEKQLREQLSQLEKESDDLRDRMLEAHRLALIDALTGLPNRMAYDERIKQEFARWRRFAEPLTLLVWDVDDFKSINDRYGHQAGDKALRVIAHSLEQRLRETDFIARYGGEEFVTLLCGAAADESLKVAEEMRESVMKCAFHSAGKAVKVTISCGLSQFIEGDSVEAVFARADKAVYKAKRAGKNRCEIA